MATLIKPTPRLKGKDAKKFIENIHQNQETLIDDKKLSEDISLFFSIIKKIENLF